ncbi:hypothetical protein U14_04184 [Candidatus Moduliflexus flocculans]|uniref:Uncharacterized protein n=1 Tax=Candidatus Moduliflexus flocculans TaxID=1499966 RepID=A0A0S6W5I9_9BACT|nr:hypothetical protein U14_04184 [Candidatus Moduliflexus flocculans]
MLPSPYCVAVTERIASDESFWERLVLQDHIAYGENMVNRCFTLILSYTYPCSFS